MPHGIPNPESPFVVERSTEAVTECCDTDEWPSQCHVRNPPDSQVGLVRPLGHDGDHADIDVITSLVGHIDLSSHGRLSVSGSSRDQSRTGDGRLGRGRPKLIEVTAQPTYFALETSHDIRQCDQDERAQSTHHCDHRHRRNLSSHELSRRHPTVQATRERGLAGVAEPVGIGSRHAFIRRSGSP
jgi:hypothetical protein